MKLLKLIGNILSLPFDLALLSLGVCMTLLKFPKLLLTGNAYVIKVKWKFLIEGIKRLWNNANNRIHTDIVSTIELRDENGVYSYKRINGHRILTEVIYDKEEENIGESKECNTKHS